MDRFQEILRQLGEELHIPLHPDKHHVCRLNIQNLYHVQIEFEEAKERLLMMSFICEVPPGKFREIVLKEALRFNATFPRLGTLAYSDRNNRLALFQYVGPLEFSGPKLATSLTKFIEKMEDWKRALDQGRTPDLGLPASKKEPPHSPIQILR